MGLRRIVTTVVFCGLGLALGSPSLAQPNESAFGPTVTVAPLRGKGGAACAKKLGRWLDEQVPIERWHGGAAVGGFRTFEALSQFVEKKGRALGAQIVVVGTARSNKLVLEAYAVKSGALLHLARIPIPKAAGHCMLGRRGRKQLTRFVAQAVKAYQHRKAVAARRAADAADPLAKARVATATLAAVALPPSLAPVQTSTPSMPKSDFEGSENALRAAPRKQAGAEPEPRAAVPAFEPTWIEIEPQVGLGQRNFAFKADGGSTRHSYLVGALFTPGFRVQLRPYLIPDGDWGRLSLDLNYQQSPSFQSRRQGMGPLVRSGYSEFQAVVHYPIAFSNVDIGPQVGFHSLAYALGGTAAGAMGEDTPSVNYRSLLAGLRLRAPLGRTAELRASASYLPLLAAGEVFSSKYYPNGSGWGLRLQAGATVRVHQHLHVVVAGHFTAYALQFGVGGGVDDGLVTEAVDRSSGLRLGLRLGF